MGLGLQMLAVGLAAAGGAAMGFEPPDRIEQREAVGPLDGLPRIEQLAYGRLEDFSPLPPPGPGDWLTVHPERGQTYAQFQRQQWPRPDTSRQAILLQPMGDFLPERSPPLDALRKFAAAFFQMRVEVLPTARPDERRVTSRRNRFTGQRQWLTRDLLRWLAARRPPQAFCLLGLTCEDLYPDPSWNFVFGEALLSERVGVYSFARYDPAFYGEPRQPEHARIVLRRSCKVLAHEAGHLFGLAHCIYFHCLMNGSNHLGESDARPLHLCPVCLRKLHSAIGFDLVTRYRDLAAFYQEVAFEDEAEWALRRLEALGAK